MASKRKAKTTGGKGLKPVQYKLLKREPDGTKIEFPDGSERVVGDALELAVFHARTVDAAIGRRDWDCVADCIERNEKLIPYASLRQFIARILRGEKPPPYRLPTEEARARRFEVARVSRMLEGAMSTGDALAKVAEMYGVEDTRTVQKMRAEHPPITTRAEIEVALQKIQGAEEKGLLDFETVPIARAELPLATNDVVDAVQRAVQRAIDENDAVQLLEWKGDAK